MVFIQKIKNKISVGMPIGSLGFSVPTYTV